MLTGNTKAAQDILQRLEENVPDLLMVTLERISLERRLGNQEEVVSILRKRIEAHKKPEIKMFFVTKLSRYFTKVSAFVTGRCAANFAKSHKTWLLCTMFLFSSNIRGGDLQEEAPYNIQ